MITEEFKELLENSEASENTPSCSLAEALTKQDLFINSAPRQFRGVLIMAAIQRGYIIEPGFFLNLRDFRTTPLKVA